MVETDEQKIERIVTNRQYTTRDGQEARIYAVDAGGEFSVHAAVKNARGKWLTD